MCESAKTEKKIKTSLFIVIKHFASKQFLLHLIHLFVLMKLVPRLFFYHRSLKK